MNTLKYPLIVSDFDGTLVQDDATISDKNKQAIEKYIRDGGVFAISTGRMPSGIMPRVKELDLKGVVSCCQGAIIMEIESGKLLLSEKLSHEVTLQIVEKMEELGLHIHLYGDWDYYCNMDDEALKWYVKAVKKAPIMIPEGKVASFVKENGFCAYKVLAMVRPEDNERVYKELENCNFEGCAITKSSEFLVEVINKNYSKGTAVRFLAEHYGAPIDGVIAVGDQCNDLPMIEAAGIGIAVKNAEENLKTAADYVCEKTNNESAIADIIETFVYKDSL